MPNSGDENNNNAGAAGGEEVVVDLRSTAGKKYGP